MRPLNEDDKEYIRKEMKCPDCREGNLLAGPMGLSAQNVQCAKPSCGHYFNLIYGFGCILMVHRIREDDQDVAAEIARCHPGESVPLEQIDVHAGESARDEKWQLVELLIKMMDCQESVEYGTISRSAPEAVENMAIELAIRLTGDNVRLTNEHLVDVGQDEIADGRNRLRVKPIRFSVNMHAPGERYEMLCKLLDCFLWLETNDQQELRSLVAEMVLRITRRGIEFATDEEMAAQG